MVRFGVVFVGMLGLLAGCVSFEITPEPKNWVGVSSEPVSMFDGDHNVVEVFDSKSFSFVNTVPSGVPPFVKVFDDVVVDEREGKVFIVVELRRNAEFDNNVESPHLVEYEKINVMFFDDADVDLSGKTFLKCYFYQGEVRVYEVDNACIVTPSVLVVEE